LGGLVIFIKNRDSEADSHIFGAELALSFGLWALVMPMIGMMHMVLFPLVLAILLAALKAERPIQYRVALYVLGSIYLLGWVGFVFGVLVPGFYGSHITWVELAYKEIVPIILILLAILICLPGLMTRWSPGYD
jgi:hypothetical protein